MLLTCCMETNMPSITNSKLESEIKPKPIRYKLWRDGELIVGDFNNIGLHHGKRASKIKFCVLLVTAAFTPNAKNNEYYLKQDWNSGRFNYTL